MADEMFPERPLWRDIDRVKHTPHMNWGDCSCSQCCIWRIVARLEAAEARLAEVEALDPDDLGHGLFCASHYESRPCDCWAIVVRAAARGEGDQ